MQHFIVRLKVLLRSKANLFWTFIYPLLLGLFFHMGFGNLHSRPSLNTVDVFVASEKMDPQLLEVMKMAEYSDGKKVFLVHSEYTSAELETILQAEKITGYIYYENHEIVYRLRKNGLPETIIKSFLDDYLQTVSIHLEIQTLDPNIREQVLSDFLKNKTYLEEVSAGTNPNHNAFVIYFYALIAMTCMFGSFWGVDLVNDIQADNSSRALRMAIAPTSKMKLVIIYFLAALAVHFSGNLVLLAYLKLVLKVEFANNLLLIILTTFIGCIAGISLGTLLSSYSKGSYGRKNLMMVGVSLLLSALSGLMFISVKYWVETNLPFLVYLNPAGLVTNSFYRLYYFSELKHYFLDLGVLLILSILMLFGSIIKIRGVKYDSV